MVKGSDNRSEVEGREAGSSSCELDNRPPMRSEGSRAEWLRLEDGKGVGVVGWL